METSRWLIPSWMSPASRRRSVSCAAITCSVNRSSARCCAASLRCSRAWCIAPATRLPIVVSSLMSRSVNSRRCLVCTFSTPTSPASSLAIGTEAIEVYSQPRSAAIRMYRRSASLRSVITAGRWWLATQPVTPPPSGRCTWPTCSSNGGVAPARVSERSASSSTCTKQTSVAVASVIRCATAAASGSTSGPADTASTIASSSAFSRSRSARPSMCWVTGRCLPAVPRPPRRPGRSRPACGRSTGRGS